MRRRLLQLLIGLCLPNMALAFVPVTPATIPHITFVDASGNPCAACQLFTFTAGTSTPLATYTSADGTSVNTNPIILDAAGGANVWLGRNSYKFILKTAAGSTIWTVDQVNAATLFPCGPANSVQFANSGVNALDCDSQIFIDKINHTFNVGTISVNHVTIGALSTPTTWFFDTTSPATACASIGCNFTFPGAGIPKSTGTAWGTSYTTTGSGTVVALATSPVFITPTLGVATATSIQIASGVAMTGNQGNGLLVQHSTGSTTSGHSAAFDANGNVVDSGSPVSSTAFGAVTDQTGSRTFGIAYQNTGTTAMYISGYGSITGGSGDSTITCAVGASSPSISVWSDTVEATASGRPVGFSCMVPPAYFYSVTVTNIISATPTKWVEYQ